jgi:hypothetical protein
VSFSKTGRIEGVAFLGRRSILYFVVVRVGRRMPEGRAFIRGGVCAFVIVDIVVGNGSLVLVGHTTWVGE